MGASDRILQLSMSPSDINSDLIHNKIIEGFVLTCAIDEIEDHGYIIDTGIHNLRAFLPKSKALSNDYVEGQLISCIVESIECSKSASTAKLRCINRIQHKTEENVAMIPMLLPQSIVKFKIKKIIKGIVTGTVCNDGFQAAVLNYHLEKPTTTPNDYTEGLEVDARVVCIMPLSKIVYLTLNLKKLVKLNSPGILPINKVVKNAEVIRQTESSVELKLKNNFKGIIKRHAGGNDAVLNPGQKLKVKLLEYNIFDRIYLCSNDTRLLQEHDFTVDKLKVGERVDFVVLSINEDGIIGFIGIYGNLKTFMPNIDISMQNMKKGDLIPVKITQISPEGKISVTNREEYVNPKKKTKILMNIDDVKINDVFTGTVVKEFSKFFLIRFFNDIAGTISKITVTETKLKIGGVMNFKITDIRDDASKAGKKKLYLKLPEGSENDENLGEIFEATVKGHIPTGVNIKLEDKTIGFISNLSFALSPSISQQICKSFKEGDSITCVCIGNGIYSVRCVDYYSKNPIRSLRELSCNDIVRSYVKNIVGNQVQLYLPIKGLTNNVTLSLKSFIEAKELVSKLELSSEQIVYLKVQKIKENSIECTPKMSEIWKYDFKFTTKYFMQYLQEYEKLRTSLSKRKNPIAKYKIGDTVKGKIIAIDEITRDLHIELDNSLKGTIKKNLYKSRHMLGDTVEATILWIDYITHDIDLQTKFEKSDVKIRESDSDTHKGMIILEKEYFLLAFLKSNHVPVLIPKHVHFNDFFSIIKAYSSHKNAKLLVLKQYMGHYIGMFAEFYFTGNTFKIVNLKTLERKRKNDTGPGVDDDLMDMLRLIKRKKGDMSNLENGSIALNESIDDDEDTEIEQRESENEEKENIEDVQVSSDDEMDK